MTEENFIDAIRSAFPLSGGLLLSNTCYKDLADWNSMTLLLLITTIGEKFDIDLSPDDALDAETVAELFRVAQTKIKDGTAATGMVARGKKVLF